MKNSVFKMPEKPKGGVKSKYPDEFRKEVAETYLTSSFSMSQICSQFELPNRGMVNSFLNWYKSNFDLSNISLNPEKTGTANTIDNSTRLKEKELEKMLEFAKLKIESLESMIDIAEDQFQIDIRKKSGAKSSKK